MELVDNPYVSDFTRKTLAQFGWQDNDPIPADLGEWLVKVKETLPTSSRTDILIDANLMAPGAVEFVKAQLAEAKSVAAVLDKQKEKQQQLEKIAPQIRGQYESVLRQLEVVDDRAAQESASGPAESAPAKTEDAPAQTEKDPAPAPAAPGETETALAAFSPAPVIPFCPRCGWNMRQKFESVPTERDKEDFLATILGNSRFRKTYELFGGKIVITLRSLMAEENRLIYRQLVLDQADKQVATEAEWYLRFQDYRLACSLERVATAAGKVLAEIPELNVSGFKTSETEPFATPIPAQLQFVNKTALGHEATRRLIAQNLSNFQRLVEAMEAMALEPSFWDGIQ